MTDEELYYMDTYYLEWLKSAHSYHFSDGGECTMEDTFWDGLARLYTKCLPRYPFLNECKFTGSTLGVGVNEGELLDEINSGGKINNYYYG